jgi:hypothetical protein
MPLPQKRRLSAGWSSGPTVSATFSALQLTFNCGIRFDQLYRFVENNQLGLRAALI